MSKRSTQHATFVIERDYAAAPARVFAAWAEPKAKARWFVGPDEWEKLSEGGAKMQCGWLKDKYGLSWQIVPTVLRKLMQDKDAEGADRVMQAILQMDKLDIKPLEQADNRKSVAQAASQQQKGVS
jgi:hypothetical protein